MEPEAVTPTTRAPPGETGHPGSVAADTESERDERPHLAPTMFRR
jgi:hypothetical protein